MSEPAPGHGQDVDPDNMHPELGYDDNLVDWLPSVDGDDDPTRIDAEPLSAEVEPVDVIAAMHDDLAQSRRDLGRARESQSAIGSEDGPSADQVGGLTAEAVNVGARGNSSGEQFQTRGAANFSAWQETRRQLEGEDATFVIDLRVDNGSSTKLDLMRVKFQDLPAAVQAEFEHRKFPDLSALTLSREAAESIEPVSLEVSKSDNPAARDSANARTPWSARDPQEMDARPQGLVERARPWPMQTSSGFGISLGGLARSAQRAMKGTGHLTGGTGRSATSALTALREQVGVTGGRPRTWLVQHIRTWREARATEALERLAVSQAQFENALRVAREHPELRGHFRSWNSPSTAATRRRAVQRFRNAIVNGRISGGAVEHIEDLFQQAEVVRTDAVRAIRRVNSTAHGANAVQRGLAAWFRRVGEQSGPLASVDGESLAERLTQMAEAIGKVFEQLAERIARLTSAHPN
jgi:hypothetical protein